MLTYYIALRSAYPRLTLIHLHGFRENYSVYEIHRFTQKKYQPGFSGVGFAAHNHLDTLLKHRA